MSDAAPTNEFETLLLALRQAGERVNAQADVLTLTAAWFESMPIPAWIKSVGPDNTVTMLRVNRACERVTGISAAEYAGLPDSAVYAAKIADKAALTDLAAITTGEPQRVDSILFNKVTGAPVRLIGWKWRVPSHGHAIAICGFGQEFPVQ